MSLVTDDFRQLAMASSESMLAQECPPIQAMLAGANGQTISATMRISGAWDGMILLDFPADLIGCLPAGIFDANAPHGMTAELEKAISTLFSNRLAAILPADCYLSSPLTRCDDQSWAAIQGCWPLGHFSFRFQNCECTCVVVEDIGGGKVRAGELHA